MILVFKKVSSIQNCIFLKQKNNLHLNCSSQLVTHPASLQINYLCLKRKSVTLVLSFFVTFFRVDRADNSLSYPLFPILHTRERDFKAVQGHTNRNILITIIFCILVNKRWLIDFNKNIRRSIGNKQKNAGFS